MANFEDYKIFYQVAKNRNITRAAEQLYMTQPAITKAIQRLEVELGVTLFLRSRKGVELTSEGEKLYQQVSAPIKALIASEKRAEREIVSANSNVWLSANFHFANVYMPEILVGFKQKYPNIAVNLECHDKSSKSMEEYLEEFDIYIGFMREIDEAVKQRYRLKERELIKLRDVLFVGEPLFHLAENEISLKDVSDYPLITSKSEGWVESTYTELFARYGKTLNILAADGTDFRMALLRQGAGILVTSENNGGEEEATGTIRRLAIREELPTRRLKMITKSHSEMKASAVALQNYIAKWFEENN